MSILSTVVLLLAGMTLLVSIFHLGISRSIPQHRENLTFGISCLLMMVYDVLCAGLYSAQTPQIGMLWQRGQVATLGLLSIAFLWFFIDFTKIKATFTIKALSIYFGVAVILDLLIGRGLVLQQSNPSIKDFILPIGSGIHIIYNEVAAGPLVNIQNLVSLAGYLYLYFVALDLYRKGDREKTGPFIIAMVLFFAGIVSDTLVSLRVYSFLYTIEYAFMGIAVLMGRPLIMQLVESARNREALVLSETRLKTALETAAAEKERLAVTLRSIGDGVIATDTAGTIMVINPVAEQLTGWTEELSLGRPLAEIFGTINGLTREPCTNPVEMVMKTGRTIGLENRTVLVAKDGTERNIADSAAPIRKSDGTIVGAVLVFRDTTTRQKIEEELNRAQKLDSLGILAGGIAHDFNNLLTGILGNLSLARLMSPLPADLAVLIKEAEFASLQAKKLTFQLLTFAKGGAPIKKVVSIASIIEDSARFALRGSKARPEFSLAADLSAIDADEGQIGQVMSNLVINADQAMPDGGTIAISAENCSITTEQATLPLDPGRYVVIKIQDSGIGIRKEQMSRIFDPFYTTKQKGGGLGLSITYSIVRKHGGHIGVESEPGIGTTFSVYLPAVAGTTGIRAAPAFSPGGGHGTVLIIDDEEIVRTAATKLLGAAGYSVVTVADGHAGLALYKEKMRGGERFNAVLVDLTIPGGLGGKEIINQLLAIDPSARAIVSSGYSNDPIMAHFRDFGFKGVIAKPYSVDELIQVVKRVVVEGA